MILKTNKYIEVKREPWILIQGFLYMEKICRKIIYNKKNKCYYYHIYIILQGTRYLEVIMLGYMSKSDDNGQNIIYSYAQDIIDEPTIENIFYIVNKIYSSQLGMQEKFSQIELLKTLIIQQSSNDEFLKLCNLITDKPIIESYADLKYLSPATSGGGSGDSDDFIFYLISLLINNYTIEQAEKIFNELTMYCSNIQNTAKRKLTITQHVFFIISIVYFVLNTSLKSVPIRYLINEAYKLRLSN